MPPDRTPAGITGTTAANDATKDAPAEMNAPQAGALTPPAEDIPSPMPPVAPPAAKTPAPGGIDLQKILLPKKEGAPSILSAERVNAGALLEAESAPFIPTPPPDSEHVPAPSPARTPAASTVSAASAEYVPVIHTYKSDIEETVRNKNISLMDIAAAQARRAERASTAGGAAPSARTKIIRALEIGGGALLLLAAAAIGAVALLHPAVAPTAPALPSPIIAVDEMRTLSVAPDTTRAAFMQTLEQNRESVSISLGLISQLSLMHAPASATSTASAPFTSSDFFALVAPEASSDLVRALAPEFLLGIHSFEGNQPFLIFKTAAYAQAFAGMLSWEGTMQADLAPLFTRTPAPRIPEQGSVAAATSTQFLQTPFVDRVVENHDARVIQDSQGNILLLWTFVDRNTLVITTNEYTLREVIARLSNAVVVPVPGQ